MDKLRLASRVISISLISALQINAASALEIEEIVVEARKRQESLQDVPIAVSAISGDMMTALGVESAGDVALFTPNFTWNTEFGRASPQPYLRGIGTNNFAPINSGPIAVYQDSIFIGPNIAQGFATFDIERAEVLKGPQGTLYGRNSTGGLINFISRKPEIGAGNNGYARIEIGDFNTTNYEGAWGFDLSETSSGRIAITRNLNKGSFKNENPEVDSDKVGSIDDWAIRTALLFEPSDDLSVLGNLHYGRANPDTAPFKQIGLLDPTTFAPCDTPSLGSGCVALLSSADDRDIFTTAKNNDFEDVESYGGFIEIRYDLSEEISITSLTSYDYAELARLDDSDDVITELELDHYYDEFDFYSQELRLSKEGDTVNWHVGLYYYNESNEGILAFTNPIFGTGEANAHEVDTESYAVFGQIDWNVTDKIRLGMGLRWNYEEKDVNRYDSFQVMVAPGEGLIRSINDRPIFPGTLASGTTGARDFDEITGRLSIDYTTDSGNLIYASLARGVKGGDVVGAGLIPDFFGNPRTANQITIFKAQTQIVEPEILDAVEFGIKSDWFDGKLRLNGAAFFYIYKDQQQTTLQPDPTGTSPIGITSLSNAGRSEIPGAEMEVIYTPNENWFLQANFGILDPTYDEFVNPLPGAEDFTGNQIPLTPKREFTGLARYDMELHNGSIIALQVDISYKSSTFFQAQNANTLAASFLQEDSVTLWNARASYTTADDKWSAAIFVKNLTNEEYFGSGFDVASLGWVAIKPGPQRYVGASLEYKFGN